MRAVGPYAWLCGLLCACHLQQGTSVRESALASDAVLEHVCMHSEADKQLTLPCAMLRPDLPHAGASSCQRTPAQTAMLTGLHPMLC